MNTQHFRTFLWLRYRLRVNQFRKAGTLNLVFFAFIAIGSVVAAVGLLITGFFVGWLALPLAPAPVRLFVWDGIVATFLFFWTIGLLTDLQRSEGLAIDKFLHLPVSVSGAFVINYLSSLFSLTILVFLPGMIGLTVGQTIAHGPAVLINLLLIAAFLFAVTAVTYQFQGWLASLMSNPRRRRTIIVFLTMGIILLAQLPNLFNLARTRNIDTSSYKQQIEEDSQLMQQLATKKITQKEYQERLAEARRLRQERQEEESRQVLDKADNSARLISAVVPPGWLAIGAADLTRNRLWPALLGILGFGLIGSASLWRAYRTTLRLYTGQYGSAEIKKKTVVASTYIATNKPQLLERRLPWVSEHASAVAFAGLRSLSRAPEAKMALIAPIIMIVVFGGLFFSTDVNPPPGLRPLMAIGGASVMLLGALQLIGNQFGYDRAGFRAFVLSPVPRREILLGKNLAVAPLAIGLGALLALLSGIIFPMRPDHYPAVLVQLVIAYLLFCLMANALSMLAPMPMAAGTVKASDIKLVPVMIQMAFLMIFPFVFIPALLPIGVEALLNELDVLRGWPVSLVLSLIILAIVVFVYRWFLTVEGNWLSMREKKVLEVVTSKSE